MFYSADADLRVRIIAPGQPDQSVSFPVFVGTCFGTKLGVSTDSARSAPGDVTKIQSSLLRFTGYLFDGNWTTQEQVVQDMGMNLSSTHSHLQS